VDDGIDVDPMTVRVQVDGLCISTQYSQSFDCTLPARAGAPRGGVPRREPAHTAEKKNSQILFDDIRTSMCDSADHL
jgi:hypothetical protein